MWCLARRSGCSLSSIWSALRLEIRSVGRSEHAWFVTGLVTRWCPRWPLPGTPTMTCVTSTENRPPPHHQTKKNRTNAVNKEWLPKGKCHCTRMSTAWPGNRWPHLYLPAHFRVFFLGFTIVWTNCPFIICGGLVLFKCSSCTFSSLNNVLYPLQEASLSFNGS